jgi:hypothetical protein
VARCRSRFLCLTAIAGQIIISYLLTRLPWLARSRGSVPPGTSATYSRQRGMALPIVDVSPFVDPSAT